ncbi:MAG: hypothetical protein NT084_11095 [Bacteroidetes bacterium]|nr:hypothetical protein [Bacteroidota bacterium]
MEKSNNTAVVVLSCDKYADIWAPFFAFFNKFWPECPYKIYLGSNTLGFSDNKIQTIKSGEPFNWTADTRAILEQIKEKYVIVLLEDYFLYTNVDQGTLDRCVEMMEKEHAVFFRIGCFPSDHFSDYAYDKIKGNEWCGRTRIDAKYAINLQAGIWNREEFISLLKDDENPWQFELAGTKRWAASGKVCLGLVEDKKLNYVHGPITYLCTALSKGVWMRDAFELAKKENIKLNKGNRTIETKWQYRKRRMYHALPFWSRKYIDFFSNRLFI